MTSKQSISITFVPAGQHDHLKNLMNTFQKT